MRMVAELEPEDIRLCDAMILRGLKVQGGDTLEAAMPMFDREDVAFVPVVSGLGEDDKPRLIGALYHIDALKSYNRALAATAAEEHS